MEGHCHGIIWLSTIFIFLEESFSDAGEKLGALLRRRFEPHLYEGGEDLGLRGWSARIH
jgi:hypothetical protein